MTADLLEQTDVWFDGADERICVRDMDDEHLTNLRGWLLRNADRFHSFVIGRLYSLANQVGGEMALESLESAISEMQEENAYVWMEERPLFQAIDQEIDRRRGIHICQVSERT